MKMRAADLLARVSKLALVASLPVLGMATQPVQAADLAILSDAPAASWEGLYMGVHFGGAVGNIDSSDGSNSASYNFDSGDKTTGGALFGWNVQEGKFLYGLEAGISIHEIKGTYTGGALASHHSDYVWNVEARGRFGYEVGRFLPFVAGGVVAGEFYQSSNGGAGGFGEANTVFGYTVGAGVDVRVTPKIAVRTEYLYHNLNKKNYSLSNTATTLSTDSDVHMARVALLYNFGNPMMGASEPLSSDVLFAGPSLGLHVGYATGESELSNYATGSVDVSNLTAGMSVGYLYPINSFRVGVEGQIDVHSGSESTNPGGPVTDFEYRMMWHAAFRAKAGYVVNNYMPYVSAGFNLGQFTTDSQPNNNTNLDPYKKGYSFGGGLEYAVTDRMSVDFNYTYNTYDSTQVSVTGGTIDADADFHQVRVGLVLR